MAVVGEKLDAAKLGDNVDIESEVGMIQEYLRGFNEDLEQARDLWLRYELSADDIGRLTEMLNPASLGLPRFADEEQGRRAFRQMAEIGKRLGQRDLLSAPPRQAFNGSIQAGPCWESPPAVERFIRRPEPAANGRSPR